MSPESLIIIYNSLCLPHVNYCNLIWASTYNSNIQPVQQHLKRAEKIINKKINHDNTIYLKLIHNFNLTSLITYHTAIFVYKQLYNKMPSTFPKYYTINNTIKTRQKNFIKLNMARRNICYFHVKFRGPKIWNNLLKKGLIVEEEKLNIFKKKIKTFIRDNY